MYKYKSRSRLRNLLNPLISPIDKGCWRIAFGATKFHWIQENIPRIFYEFWTMANFMGSLPIFSKERSIKKCVSSQP